MDQLRHEIYNGHFDRALQIIDGDRDGALFNKPSAQFWTEVLDRMCYLSDSHLRTTYKLLSSMVNKYRNIHSVTNIGWTLLFQFAHCSDGSLSKNIIPIVLAAGVPIDKQDNLGRTAAYVAVQNGNYTALEVLIHRGANLSIRKYASGESVMHWLAQFMHVHLGRKPPCSIVIRIVNMLLKAGADLNCQNAIGYTPLMLSAGHLNISLMQVLIEKGCELNRLGGNSMTSALHIYLNFSPSVEPNWEPGILQMMLKSGANPDIQDGNGKSPIFTAVSRQGIQAVCLLVLANCDINATYMEESFGMYDLLLAALSPYKAEFFNVFLKILMIAGYSQQSLHRHIHNIQRIETWYGDVSLRGKRVIQCLQELTPQLRRYEHMYANLPLDILLGLKSFASDAFPLRQICRIAVRNLLQCGPFVTKGVHDTGLPVALQEYVLLSELTDFM